MSEVDKFFEGLPTQDKKVADVFEKPEEGKKEVQEPEKEENEHKAKDRRYRRLEKKLQEERESNIALAERIKILAELKQQETSVKTDDLDPELVEVFGDTDVGKKIAKIFEKKLESVTERARQEALEEIKKSQNKEDELVKEYSNQIDEEFSRIEELYDVDLTGDSEQAIKLRETYVEELQRRSHKDRDGNIDAYPDFQATFEDVYERMKPDNSRNKAVADRSMTRSGQADTKTDDDQMRNQLRALGIRV
jgi:hypothetical protein